MSSPRTVAIAGIACASLVIVVASCSSDRNADLGTTTSAATTLPGPTTVAGPTSTLAPATTAAVVTTLAPTTTVAPTTSTTEAPTTTTEVPGASVPLRFDGLGDARFGSDPDDVITYLSDQLGDPTADSDWVAAPQIGCKGGQARVVFWNDLRLTFGDESNVSSGRRHFFAWRLGPPAETALQPAGLKTLLGVSVGSTVRDLQGQYPALQLFAGDASTTPSAQLSDGLFAYLTNTTPDGVVTQLVGGQDCSG